MAHRGHRALFPIVLFAALPVFAQTAQAPLPAAVRASLFSQSGWE